MSNTLIIIPVRMASKRFPGKPMVNIQGKQMILRVWEKAVLSKIGDVIIACCDEEIKNLLYEKNIPFIMTKKNLNSGTDRVYQAFKKIKNKKKYKYIINLQGDLPTINPKHIKQLCSIIKIRNINIATLVSKIKEEKKISQESIVKVVLGKKKGKNFKVIYFSRAPIPLNAIKYYEHVGIYAYTSKTLKEFVNLKSSRLEMIEQLEQLRAIENNLEIYAGEINNSPISIDVPDDIKLLLKDKTI